MCLIENFRPDVMGRIGLDYDVVAARNPRIVYVSISGYGSTGPWVSRRAYAPTVGAETGITKAQGEARGGQYANDPFSHADVYTSLEAASAVLAALFNRERTGRGDRIEVSMAETMLYVNEHAHDQLWDGEAPPEWVRSFGPDTYPVVTTANGESVVISGHPAEQGIFDRYMIAAGRQELIDDPRFIDVPTRQAHLADVIEVLRRLGGDRRHAGSNRGSDGRARLGHRHVAIVARSVRHRLGARAWGGRRGQRPRWRHSSTAQLAVALRQWRCQCAR